MLQLLFSLNDPSPTWFTIALLGAWPVALQYGPIPRGRWAAPLLVGLGVLIAIVAGCNAASDRLAVVGGLIPLALSGVLAWRWHPSARSRAAGAGALATAVLAGIVAALTTHAMRSHGVTYIGDITFGSTTQVQANFTLWWQSLVFLGNGNFFSSAGDFEGVLAAACAVAVLAAAVGALRASWLELNGPLAGSARNAGNTQGADRDAGRIAYTSFWASAGLLLSAAYLLSST